MRCSALQCASPSGEHPHLCNPNASTERGSDMRRLLTHLRRARRVRDVTNVPIRNSWVIAGGFFWSSELSAFYMSCIGHGLLGRSAPHRRAITLRGENRLAMLWRQHEQIIRLPLLPHRGIAFALSGCRGARASSSRAVLFRGAAPPRPSDLRARRAVLCARHQYIDGYHYPLTL
jgi:hypothetical protein